MHAAFYRNAHVSIPAFNEKAGLRKLSNNIYGSNKSVKFQEESPDAPVAAKENQQIRVTEDGAASNNKNGKKTSKHQVDDILNDSSRPHLGVKE